MRFTAALDSRSSHIATGRPTASDSAADQSRADSAAGPRLPSIDSGRPTTSPPASCFTQIAATSAAFRVSFARFSAP